MIIFFIYFSSGRAALQSCVSFRRISGWLFRLFSTIGFYKKWNTVPCVICRSLLFILHIVLCMWWSQTPDLSPHRRFESEGLRTRGSSGSSTQCPPSFLFCAGLHPHWEGNILPCAAIQMPVSSSNTLSDSLRNSCVLWAPFHVEKLMMVFGFSEAPGSICLLPGFLNTQHWKVLDSDNV